MKKSVGPCALIVVAIMLASLAPTATAQKQAADLKVPDNVLFEPDIEYTNPENTHLQLDLARPKDAKGPLPAVLCIHGGGFRAGSRKSYDGLCVKLAQAGYIAATASYRLAPKHPYPAAIHDVKAAVRWLRANRAKFQIDPDRI